MSYYIEMKHIVKNYGVTSVLKGIDLGIEKGELVTLLGPSGCGKSTLLRCLAGLEEVTEGQIFLDGQEITTLEPRKREIGMVFQQYSLFPNMTVTQNVAFGLKLKKKPEAEIREKVKTMLEIVGLSEQANRYPSQLSGGQQQRAALARAIVTEPKVLLLDEPLSAIDALLRRSLQTEIRRIQQELNITAVFVTHDQNEAMVMSDRIYLLHQGQIEQSASPTEMYLHPATRFAASFIGNYNSYTGTQFAALTGEKQEAEQVVFRPEAVVFSGSSRDDADCFWIKGTVKSQISHGNVLRYTVEANGQQIHVDTLFQEGEVCQAGRECRLQLKKKDCIYY